MARRKNTSKMTQEDLYPFMDAGKSSTIGNILSQRPELALTDVSKPDNPLKHAIASKDLKMVMFVFDAISDCLIDDFAKAHGIKKESGISTRLYQAIEDMQNPDLLVMDEEAEAWCAHERNRNYIINLVLRSLHRAR